MVSVYNDFKIPITLCICICNKERVSNYKT